MTFLLGFSLVAIMTGHIFDCMPIAFAAIGFAGLTSLPIIARREARR